MSNRNDLALSNHQSYDEHPGSDQEDDSEPEQAVILAAGSTDSGSSSDSETELDLESQQQKSTSNFQHKNRNVRLFRSHNSADETDSTGSNSTDENPKAPNGNSSFQQKRHNHRSVKLFKQAEGDSEESDETQNSRQQLVSFEPRRSSTDHRSVKLFRPNERKKVVSVVPWTHSSFRLSRNKPQEEPEEHSGEYDPTANMSKKTKKRARKALKMLHNQLMKDDVEKQDSCSTSSCWRSCCSEGVSCRMRKDEDDQPSATFLTPALRKSLNEGFTMIKVIAFPAVPAVLQDLWVYLELLVSLAAFVFAMIDFYPFNEKLKSVYSSVYFGLTIFSLCLVMFDAYVYFIELGSCGRAIRYFQARTKQNSKEEDDEENVKGRGCLKPKWKQNFKMFFELGRNIATEAILFPVLVFDLFDFITEQLYKPEGSIKRADFSVFLIGSFYLLLAVYIMRVFVLAGSMYSLFQISANKKINNTTSGNGNSSSSSLIVLFCVHVLGQIVVHLIIVIAVAAKINNENPILTDTIANQSNMSMLVNETAIMEDDNGLPNASPFLWVVIVLGWLMPIVGVVIFFPINIYWMREFSIGFWINMISLLKGKSFAETVFGGDGMSTTKNKAASFFEKLQYNKVKKELNHYKSPSFFTKVFFPLRIMYAALSGLIYDIAIITFLASLMLTYQDGVVKVVIFQEDSFMTIIFILSCVCIIIANIHVLLLLNFVLLILIAIAVFYIFLAIMISPFFILVYFPSMAVIGYAYLFVDLCKLKKLRRAREAAKYQRNRQKSMFRAVRLQQKTPQKVKSKTPKVVTFEDAVHVA